MFDTASNTDHPRERIWRRKRSMAASQKGEIKLSKSSATVREGTARATGGASVVATRRFKQSRLAIVTYASPSDQVV